MQDSKVAIRYAKALLGLAVEKGQLEAVFGDMRLISQAVDSSRDLRVMLDSPVIRSDRKLGALNAIFGSELNAMTRHFLELLMKNGREQSLGAISKGFILQYKDLKGITLVEVVSATALSEAMMKRIMDILTSEIGGAVELESRVDPELIGGFVLNIGDRQLDTSLRTRFNALRQEFKTEQYAKHH